MLMLICGKSSKGKAFKIIPRGEEKHSLAFMNKIVDKTSVNEAGSLTF
jgi:hypothetical protein